MGAAALLLSRFGCRRRSKTALRPRSSSRRRHCCCAPFFGPTFGRRTHTHACGGLPIEGMVHACKMRGHPLEVPPNTSAWVFHRETNFRCLFYSSLSFPRFLSLAFPPPPLSLSPANTKETDGTKVSNGSGPPAAAAAADGRHRSRRSTTATATGNPSPRTVRQALHPLPLSHLPHLALRLQGAGGRASA